jgi:hypothetical protein
MNILVGNTEKKRPCGRYKNDEVPSYHPMKLYRRNRGRAPFMLNINTIWNSVVKTIVRPDYPPGISTVPIKNEVVRDTGPAWAVLE